MEKSLVIVESPAKAKTISKFLGTDYCVLACKGHVRALPSKPGSVQVDDDVTPHYDIIPSSKRYLKDIGKALKTCGPVYLATDLDREGEAIAWHLVDVLKLGAARHPVKRIKFHEITRDAIQTALAAPEDISQELVDAQQARVVLDYLVGFNLSPFLWKKIRYGLSAGRVQSVALRLVCEREEEIRSFVKDEFWTISANLQADPDQPIFKAQLSRIDGRKLEKLAIGTGEAAQGIVAEMEGARWTVADIKAKEVKRNPPPPFITSTLQQEASRKLGFSARKTMSIAQRLYEGIDVGSGTMGLITYMRTDSVHLADSALVEMRDIIVRLYGEPYALEKPRIFTRKSKNVQEAHEAVRPTDVSLVPDEIKHALGRDEYRLYDLIWKRAVASQMARALLDSVAIDVAAGERFVFRATGSTLRFPGFMQLYTEGQDNITPDTDQKMLPPLEIGQPLTLEELLPEQHFTQPPPRYTEASLVKTMEEHGIGRPSTYASIIGILQEREYVRLVKKRFVPEDIGMVVSSLLVTHFPRYVDYEFTSYMEDRLDQISRGEASWKPAIQDFWRPFIDLIGKKDAEVSKADVTTEQTDQVCPQCGKPLVIKLGKYGRFYACSGFPDCRYVRPLEGAVEGDDTQEATDPCETCGSPLMLRQGRYGKFYGCTRYPECTYIRPLNKPVSLGVSCPACGKGEIQEKKSRKGKVFYSCSNYPECTFASWHRPLAESCPACGSPYLVEKVTKRYGAQVLCPNRECGYKRAGQDVADADGAS